MTDDVDQVGPYVSWFGVLTDHAVPTVSHGPRDPAPDWFVREVLVPVLADLQRPTAIDVVVELEHRADQDIVWVSEAEQPGGSGRAASDPATPRAELMVEWADWLQEQFFPETAGAWGEARPECPGHPHPARAVTLDGEAYWVCPINDRRIGMIGHLGPATARTDT